MAQARPSSAVIPIGTDFVAGQDLRPRLALTPGQSSANLGVEATGWQVQNTGEVPSPWMVTATPGEVAFAAGSGRLAPGATANIGPMAMLVGLKTITLSSPAPGAVIASPASAPFTGTSAPTPPPPPPPAATALALSVTPSSGTTGSTTAAVTVTPNGPIPAGGGAASLSLAGGGTLGATSLSFSAGSTSPQSTTITRSSDGTSTITLTNNMGLSNTPSSATFASTTPSPPPPPPPPPAPALATGNPEFRLQSASTGTVPFMVGLAVRKGNLPAGIAVSGATAQVTVKNQWPDGSAKFVIVAGVASVTAGVPLTASLAPGTSSSGSPLTTTNLAAAITSAAVDAGAFGSATFSGSDWASPFATWVSGHLMSSWVYRKPVGSDAHLVAWLEVRLYAGGAVEILPWIENGYLNVASPTTKAATYTFSINGSSRFSAAITLYARQRTPLISGTALSHWVGAAHDVVVKHDAAYMAGTGLVPSYSTDISPSHAQVTGLPSSYTPLQQGLFESSLDTGGFHNGVCMLPQWDALHLSTSATSTFKAVVFQSYSAGRYAFHARNEATNLPLRINDAAFATTTWSTLPAPSQAPAQPWSYDHQPAVGYLAYLLTGAYYHMEECQFVASGNFLGTSASARQNGSGVATAALNVRAQAWFVRGLVYACTVTPDADTGSLRTAYVAHLANNIDYYWGRYINQSHNPQGFINGPVGANKWGPYNLNLNATPTGGTTTTLTFASTAFQADQAGASSFIGQKIAVGVSAPGDHAPTITAWNVSGGTLTFTVSPPMSGPPGAFACELIPKYASDAPWMQDYSIAVWGQMKSAELVSGTTDTRREAFWLWHAGQIVGRMGRWGSGEYLYRDCSPYVIATAPVNQTTFQGPNWDTGAGPWFADWGEVYAATYVASGGATGLSYLLPLDAGGSKAQGPMRASGFAEGDTLAYQSQFANSMRAIAYAVRHGVPGAEQGFQRIASSANYHLFIQNMEAAGYAQGALSPYVMPAWRRGQAVNEWRAGGTGTVMINLLPERTVWNVAQPNTYNPATGTDGGPVVAHTIQRTNGASLHGNRLNGYCGATIDTRRARVLTGRAGGHGDYWQNEITEIDMLADQPAWTMKHAGSDGDVIISQEPLARWSSVDIRRYADGYPAAVHTYYQQHIIERHDRGISSGGSISQPGTGFQNCEAWKLSTAKNDPNIWEPLDTYPTTLGQTSSSGTTSIAWAECKHPCTEVRYALTGSGVHITTPSYAGPNGTPGSGGTYSFASMSGDSAKWNNGFPFSEGPTAVDTKREKLLFTHGFAAASNTQPYLIDLTNINVTTLTRPTYSGSGAAALAAVPASSGMVYVPRLDRYLLKSPAAGGTVYSINPVTFDVTVLSTTGASVAASEGSGGGGAGSGIYGKFLFDPILRGVHYFPSADEPAYFLRLY